MIYEPAPTDSGDVFAAGFRKWCQDGIAGIDAVVEACRKPATVSPAPTGYTVNAPVWTEHGQAGRIVHIGDKGYKIEYGEPLVIDGMRIPRWVTVDAGTLDRWQARAQTKVKEAA